MYIGRKDRKEDNVAGTGLAWIGHGDTHLVDKRAATLLLKHADVWKEVPGTTADSGAAGLSQVAQAVQASRPSTPAPVLSAAPPPPPPLTQTPNEVLGTGANTGPTTSPIMEAAAQAIQQQAANAQQATQIPPEGGIVGGAGGDDGTDAGKVVEPKPYEAMEIEELRAIAKEKGVTVGNSGKTRVIELIRVADAAKAAATE
jgi:hypothetical protein